MFAHATKTAAAHVDRFIKTCCSRSASRATSIARVRKYIPSLICQLRLLDNQIYEQIDGDLCPIDDPGPEYNNQAGFDLRQTRGAFSHYAHSSILADETVPHDVRNVWASLEALAGRQDDFSGPYRIPPIKKTRDVLPTPCMHGVTISKTDLAYRYTQVAAHDEWEDAIEVFRGAPSWKSKHQHARALTLKRSRLPGSSWFCNGCRRSAPATHTTCAYCGHRHWLLHTQHDNVNMEAVLLHSTDCARNQRDDELLGARQHNYRLSIHKIDDPQQIWNATRAPSRDHYDNYFRSGRITHDGESDRNSQDVAARDYAFFGEKTFPDTVFTPTRSQISHADMLHASGIQLQDGSFPFTTAEIIAGTDPHRLDSNSKSTIFLTFGATVPTVVYKPPDTRVALIFDHRLVLSTTPTRFCIASLNYHKQQRNQIQGLLQIAKMLTNKNRGTRVHFALSLRQIAHGSHRSAWGAASILNGQESHLPSPVRAGYDNRFHIPFEDETIFEDENIGDSADADVYRENQEDDSED